ncbi:MAG: isopenicillin N synthase family oxygenase [Proteobacteria bacterium]|nr:isopenicillin N synthase family oxygenase [Pseudomonadota bacterium]
MPRIDVGALFGGSPAERADCDAALYAAASGIGFLLVAGLPAGICPAAGERADLKRIFALEEGARRPLWRRKFAPENPNVYRGWFPAQPGAATYKEGIDLGPDVAHPDWPADAADPLTEPTPLPAEAVLPGWRASVVRQYRAMESLAAALTASFARSLGLPPDWFAPLFAAGGLSTLRFIRYPPRSPASLRGAPAGDTYIEHAGRQRHTVGIAHVDTGCMTLLVQDGVDGLQARGADGGWLDVPPEEGTVVVNFGALLDRWTGGRLRATEHRVLGTGSERYSMPFFYEPRVDARIVPLPIAGAPVFAPFVFGDYLWTAVTRFVEFRGLESLRAPRATLSAR